MLFRFLKLFGYSWLAVATLVAAQAASPTPAITPHVDERVELLSIVFRLAGNSEYNMNQLPAYTTDIDRYFAPYKEHPAVVTARQLASANHIGYDAVMAMAISLSAPPELKPLVPFTADVPHRRWGVDTAETFLPLLRDFYRDSKFTVFFETHLPLYRMAEERFSSTLASVDFGWYRRFYGKSPDLTYHLVLGMNNGGGNYGPRLILPDGRMELFSIMGCWTHDHAGNPTYTDSEYLATIIHEFNHSFVNLPVADHWKDFSGVEQIYSVVMKQMGSMGYGRAETMVNESLVRAAVIVYFQQAGESASENLRRIRREQRNGFYWMDRLVECLKQYEAHRVQYPSFSAYLPRIVEFYRDLAPKASVEAASFDAKSVHVSGIEPFANQAQDVDASLKAITILFDKPLDPEAGDSISQSSDGADHNPIVGKPSFAAGGRRLVLPVQLQPNHAYSFVLTPQAFSTRDGYPLVRYEVDFKTK
jgi:hypothetical protein